MMFLSWFIQKKAEQWNAVKSAPVDFQQRIFRHLLSEGSGSAFGKEHGFAHIRSYRQFCSQVPLRDYDAFIPYIERIKAGERDVLYPGRPLYFAKSSGTVANVKYLPVTAQGAKTYTQSGLNMLCAYAHTRRDASILTGQKIFIQGSPALDDCYGIRTGRMSGISYHLVPWFLKSFQSPSYEANTTPVWERKLKRIAAETKTQNMRIVAGIPPWVMMYFDEIMDQTGKKSMSEVFPNLSLYIHGGVHFDPYRAMLMEKIGKNIDTLDTYTASEGFFGFQEIADEKAMTLCCNNGIFYEFVPVEEIQAAAPTRLTLEEAEIGRDYALVLNTLSGLWGYLIGDTIRFVQKNPWRFVITGRVAEYTSLFGEHVIEQEVRKAMEEVCAKFKVRTRYFTVAPLLMAGQGLSHHQWWIEFEHAPADMTPLEAHIDEAMCRQNPYYKDLITGNILSRARIIPVAREGFNHCLYATGKMDGQNKVPLLSNHRKWAEALEPHREA